MLRALQRTTKAHGNACIQHRASTVTYKIPVHEAVIQLPLKHTVNVLHAAFGPIPQKSILIALQISVRPPRHHRQQQETAFRGEPQHCLGGKKGEEEGEMGLCWQSSQKCFPNTVGLTGTHGIVRAVPLQPQQPHPSCALVGSVCFFLSIFFPSSITSTMLWIAAATSGMLVFPAKM